MLIFGIIAILVMWSFLTNIFEKTIGKLGLETKGMRQRREDRELLYKVSQNLVELQDKHSLDEEVFRNDLTEYIEESREDR